MFQCLTSQMANNPLIVPALQGTGKGHNQNSIVAAIDIGLFTDLDSYKAQIDELIDNLKALPTADESTEVMMPGEPEFHTLAERTERGIPLPPGTVTRLREAATRFQLPLPAGL